MKILLYTQVGQMGGSFTTLLNVANSLAREHSVTLSAPDLSEEWRARAGNDPALTLVKSAELSNRLETFDTGVFHLPFSMDEVGRAALSKKTLVVMEIMSLHPLPFKEGQLEGFGQAIHTHEDQLIHLEKFFPKARCHQLHVVNNIDFDLPFRRTNNIASIGAAAYKHNIDHVLKMVSKTRTLKQYLVYSREGVHAYKGRRKAITWPLKYYRLRKKVNFVGIEWNVRKLYSAFDCLFHVPEHGNGTSIVVSDALACGKPVVLSSLDAYKRAYSGMTGISFAEDVDYDLSEILGSYDEEYFAKIKSDYKKVYDRDAVLRRWRKIITE